MAASRIDRSMRARPVNALDGDEKKPGELPRISPTFFYSSNDHA